MHDLGIIGGGPAGYIAAERAAQYRLNLVLFENQKLGGICLNEGCIPTKTLLYSAKLFENIKKGEKFGIHSKEVIIDFPSIMKRKEETVNKLLAGVELKMKKNNIEVVRASASIEERGNGFIVVKAGDKLYQCNNLLICTGSDPKIPAIKGLENSNFFTSSEILQIDHIPSSLTIIGGGAVGLEFADFFSVMGSKVTVIEILDEILPGIDKDISQILRRELIKKGTTFYLDAKIELIEGKIVVFKHHEKEVKVESEEMLVCIGRKPKTEGFGLEKLRVELLNDGIKIDEHCRTNIPNVYAAGDITGFSMLAHTASREGEVAVNHIYGQNDRMRYQAIPVIVYTNPEVSAVGLTEEIARQQNIEFEVRKLPMTYSGRFLAENEGFRGLCKILTGKIYHEILGVQMIGNPSSEIIYGAAMAIESQLTLREFEQIVFPHPTVSEIFKETVLAFRDQK